MGGRVDIDTTRATMLMDTAPPQAPVRARAILQRLANKVEQSLSVMGRATSARRSTVIGGGPEICSRKVANTAASAIVLAKARRRT